MQTPGPALEPEHVGRTRHPVTWLLLVLVRAYQLIVSPWLAPSCKYYPSCSAYAVTALGRHGPVRGTGLAAWRLLRCNPWSKGGVDHVPPRHSKEDAARADPMQEMGGEARTLGQTTGGVPDMTPPTRGARAVAPQDL